MYTNESGQIIIYNDSGAPALILPMSDISLADEITAGGPPTAETGWKTPPTERGCLKMYGV